MENKITALCQECDKQFEYVLKPGYPRKYCPECSAIKKAAFADKTPAPVKPELFGGEHKPKMSADAPGYSTEPTKWPKTDNKHTTMYVSYAKDIFGNLLEEEPKGNWSDHMANAIELVKQAKEAFE